MNFKSKIREIPNFPVKGINFKDITTLLQDGKSFRLAIDALAKPYLKNKPDIVVGIDARGFLLSSAVAYKLKRGLAIIRKKGKLPYEKIWKEYILEYTANIIEMHKDAIKLGEKVLVVDDVLATGGTMKATVELVEELGGKIIGIAFLVELDYLGGRKESKGYPIYSLVHYDK